MVWVVDYHQMSVVVATVLAILIFITSCFYSILNSAKNNMSIAYFECENFWRFEAKRSKKQQEAENEYTVNAGRLLRRANWWAGLYKDYCIIVRCWFGSVILMFFSFLVIMGALTFSQLSHFFWILFVPSIIYVVRAVIIVIKKGHPYESKLQHLNGKMFWDIMEVFNPHLANEKLENLKDKICECPKWFEDNKDKLEE